MCWRAGVIASVMILAMMRLMVLLTEMGRVSLMRREWFLGKRWRRPKLNPGGGELPLARSSSISWMIWPM
jgi:hypothetical protein